MSKTFLLIFLVSVLASGWTFNLPKIEDFFSSIVNGGTKQTAAETDSGDKHQHERTKRQSPGIGDESQLAHEARTSAYVQNS